MRYIVILVLLLPLLAACSGKGSGKAGTGLKADTAARVVGIDLGSGYSLDTATATYYYRAAKLAVADTATFSVLADGYAADDSTGYYQGRPFRAEYAHTLSALGGGYAKDKFSAYYRGREIATAQASTFEYVAGDTARDQLDLYVNGVKQYSN